MGRRPLDPAELAELLLLNWGVWVTLDRELHDPVAILRGLSGFRGNGMGDNLRIFRDACYVMGTEGYAGAHDVLMHVYGRRLPIEAYLFQRLGEPLPDALLRHGWLVDPAEIGEGADPAQLVLERFLSNLALRFEVEPPPMELREAEPILSQAEALSKRLARDMERSARHGDWGWCRYYSRCLKRLQKAMRNGLEDDAAEAAARIRQGIDEKRRKAQQKEAA